MILAGDVFDFGGRVVCIKCDTGQNPRAIWEGFQPVLIPCIPADCGVSYATTGGECGAIDLCDCESVVGIPCLGIKKQSAHCFGSRIVPILRLRGHKRYFNRQRGCFERSPCCAGIYESRTGCSACSYCRHSGLMRTKTP